VILRTFSGQIFLPINLHLYINCHAAFALFENDERVDVKVCDFGMVHKKVGNIDENMGERISVTGFSSPEPFEER
jgi:hypothetical protein